MGCSAKFDAALDQMRRKALDKSDRPSGRAEEAIFDAAAIVDALQEAAGNCATSELLDGKRAEFGRLATLEVYKRSGVVSPTANLDALDDPMLNHRLQNLSVTQRVKRDSSGEDRIGSDQMTSDERMHDEKWNTIRPYTRRDGAQVQFDGERMTKAQFDARGTFMATMSARANIASNPLSAIAAATSDDEHLVERANGAAAYWAFVDAYGSALQHGQEPPPVMPVMLPPKSQTAQTSGVAGFGAGLKPRAISPAPNWPETAPAGSPSPGRRFEHEPILIVRDQVRSEGPAGSSAIKTAPQPTLTGVPKSVIRDDGGGSGMAMKQKVLNPPEHPSSVDSPPVVAPAAVIAKPTAADVPVIAAPPKAAERVTPIELGKRYPRSQASRANAEALAPKRVGEQEASGILGAKNHPPPVAGEVPVPVAAAEEQRLLSTGTGNASPTGTDPRAVTAMAGGGPKKPRLTVAEPRHGEAGITSAGHDGKGNRGSIRTNPQPSPRASMQSSVKTAYPQPVWDEIGNLERNLPALRGARLRPTNRGTGRGKQFEGVATGTSTRGTSISGRFRSGEQIEFDDILPNGTTVDTKDWASPADLHRRARDFRGIDQGSLAEKDFDFARDDAVARAASKVDDVVADALVKARLQMEKQARFIEEFGLPPGQWLVNDPHWFELLERVHADLPAAVRSRIELFDVE